MAAASSGRVIMPTDILYLVTFTLGMLAFWASGHAAAFLPRLADPQLAVAASLLTTAGVYGLVMLVLALVVLRRHVLGALATTLISVVLGLGTAQIVIRLAAGHIHSKQDLGILTFVLYFLYGGIYMLALAVGRKLAKPRLEVA